LWTFDELELRLAQSFVFLKSAVEVLIEGFHQFGGCGA